VARLALLSLLLVSLAGCSSSKKAADRHAGPTTRADGDIVFSVFEDTPVAECGGLFAVDPAARRIRALAGFGRGGPALQPTFSPDGLTFTVASFMETGTGIPGQWIYRWDRGSGRLRRVTRSDAPFAPVWSSRSDAFIVIRVKGTSWSLHTVDGASGDEHEVVSSVAPFGYSWSPDGARVAYTVANRRAQRYDVWTIARDGMDERLLARDATDPLWLADGTIAYWVRANGDASDLKISRADGTHVRTVPGGPFVHALPSTRLSNRHRRALLLLRKPRAGAKSDYNDGDLVVQDIDADSAGRVVARNVLPVQWSPSGRRILILRPRSVDGETVFLVSSIDAGGKNERALAVIDEQDVNGTLSLPAWSPTRGPIAPATGNFSPEDRVRACAHRIEALRKRVSG
jgi:Tol biopolymer transport system component